MMMQAQFVPTVSNHSRNPPVKNAVACIALLQLLAFCAAAQAPEPHPPGPQTGLNIAVTDENGVAASLYKAPIARCGVTPISPADVNSPT
jgi:hypothetical protein